jgi:hypothetical protein
VRSFLLSQGGEATYLTNAPRVPRANLTAEHSASPIPSAGFDPPLFQAKAVPCRAKKSRGVPAPLMLQVRRPDSVVSQSSWIVSGPVLPAPQGDVGQNADAQKQRSYGYRAAFETSTHRPKHRFSFPLLLSQLLTNCTL